MCSRIFLLAIVLALFGCKDSPLGKSKLDSSFNPGASPEPPADTENPTAPTNLVLSGNPTLSDTPTASWAASSDNVGVSSYEVALGTTSGGTEISDFADIGNVTTYQFTGVNPAMTPTGTFFISVRAKDAANNLSDTLASSSFAPALQQTTAAYHYPDNTYGQTCLEYLNSGYYNSEGDDLYWIDPDGTGPNAQLQAYCDMTRNGGGWTLVSNRAGGTDNVEACGGDLNAFFQNTCGVVTSIGYSDSYSIGDTNVRDNIVINGNGEFMFLHFDNMAALDSDDGFVIHHTSDLFFNSTGVLNRTAVTQVCDVNNANCDNTGVEFLWDGDGFFSSSRCNSGHTVHAQYKGNYGYCHNGSAAYNANSLFGDRDEYNETKLWDYGPKAGDAYQEQLFIR